MGGLFIVIGTYTVIDNIKAYGFRWLLEEEEGPSVNWVSRNITNVLLGAIFAYFYLRGFYLTFIQ
tara:strand:- start:671 stop:865 length:195 start_codon:yes stop_codon:yes gene_type:complete